MLICDDQHQFHLNTNTHTEGRRPSSWQYQGSSEHLHISTSAAEAWISTGLIFAKLLQEKTFLQLGTVKDWRDIFPSFDALKIWRIEISEFESEKCVIDSSTSVGIVLFNY